MRLTFCLQSLTNLETQIMIGSLDSICNFSDVFTLAFSRLVIFKNPNKASRSNLSKMKIRFQAFLHYQHTSSLSFRSYLLARTGANVQDGWCRTKTREQDVRRQYRPRVSPRECSGRCLRLSWRLAFFIKPTFLYIYLTGRWSRQGKVSIRIVDFREMTGTADIFICPV